MRLLSTLFVFVLLMAPFKVMETTAAAPSSDDLALPTEKHLRNVRQLTFGGENAEAYFSTDGRELIFQSKRDALECDQIFTMNADGTGVRMVSTGEGRTTCSYFFPRKGRILYASTHGAAKECPPRPDFRRGYVWPIYPSYDIFTARADGTDLKQLTRTPGYDAEATVSADGQKIVFTSMRDGDLDIYTMDASGKNVRRLTSELGYDGGPFFSRDRKQIVYRAYHPQTPEQIARYKQKLAENVIEPNVFEIWVMNADGTNKRQVTRSGAASFAPYFFPDGKRIIFASNMNDPKGRNFDLYTIKVDGTGLERITFEETFDGFPMFSPDGRKLVFASNRNAKARGDTNVFIADWVESTGKLKGLILDPTGGRIPAAVITIEGQGFKKEVVSDDEGSYEVELSEGRYGISVERDGFFPLLHKSIRVVPDSVTPLDMVLKGHRVDESHP